MGSEADAPGFGRWGLRVLRGAVVIGMLVLVGCGSAAQKPAGSSASTSPGAAVSGSGQVSPAQSRPAAGSTAAPAVRSPTAGKVIGSLNTAQSAAVRSCVRRELRAIKRRLAHVEHGIARQPASERLGDAAAALSKCRAHQKGAGTPSSAG